MKRLPRPFVTRALRYVLERFPPHTHFFYGLVVVAATISLSVGWRSFTWESGIAYVLVLGLLLALRLLDDVKDLDIDRSIHPDRALPRGLLLSREAMFVVVIIIASAVVLTAAIAAAALPSIGLFLLYAYLMFRGFFAREWVEDRIVLFVGSHTLIAAHLILFIHGFLSNSYFWRAPGYVFALGGVAWFASAAYDSGRKLRFAQEPDYDVSYSHRLGRRRAVMLGVSSIVLLATACMVVGFLLEFDTVYYLLVAGAVGGSALIGVLALIVENPAVLKLFRLVAISQNVTPFLLIVSASLWM